MREQLKTVRSGVAFTAFVLMVSCAGHVRIDGSAKSPNGGLEAVVVARGESGKSFLEKNRKDVYLSVIDSRSDPPKYHFKTQLQILAGPLDWRIEWESPERVTFRFFEAPWTDAGPRAPPGPTIQQVTLVRHPNGTFAEVK